MKQPSPEKLIEWQQRAALKGAIVPAYFEVFPSRVHIICGYCHHEYSRNLVPNVNEPTFVCPEPICGQKNWVPIKFNLKNHL
jgi:hypothetical protein